MPAFSHQPDRAPPLVVQLADRQMECYNNADIEGFLATFATDSVMLTQEGAIKAHGIGEIRQLYERLFRDHADIHAELLGRLVVGSHCMDHERWTRRSKATGQVLVGEAIIRNTESGGKIIIAQSFKG